MLLIDLDAVYIFVLLPGKKEYGKKQQK